MHEFVLTSKEDKLVHPVVATLDTTVIPDIPPPPAAPWSPLQVAPVPSEIAPDHVETPCKLRVLVCRHARLVGVCA